MTDNMRIHPNMRKSERFGEYLIEYGPYRSDVHPSLGTSDENEVLIVLFRVLRGSGSEMDGTPIYEREESDESLPPFDQFTSNPDEAATFLRGEIKWDGCSNWLFPENADNCMLHFCDYWDPETIGALMERMFAIARKTLTSVHWNEPAEPVLSGFNGLVSATRYTFEGDIIHDETTNRMMLRTSSTKALEPISGPLAAQHESTTVMRVPMVFAPHAFKGKRCRVTVELVDEDAP